MNETFGRQCERILDAIWTLEGPCVDLPCAKAFQFIAAFIERFPKLKQFHSTTNGFCGLSRVEENFHTSEAKINSLLSLRSSLCRDKFWKWKFLAWNCKKSCNFKRSVFPFLCYQFLHLCLCRPKKEPVPRRFSAGDDCRVRKKIRPKWRKGKNYCVTSEENVEKLWTEMKR